MPLNVAIVGLGRIGGEFLCELTEQGAGNMVIRAAAELSETPGKEAARDAGIELLSLEELVGLGEEIDIIFDTSGSTKVRQQLRTQLEQEQNHHSVVAPETVTRLIWSLLTDKALPDVHANQGY